MPKKNRAAELAARLNASRQDKASAGSVLVRHGSLHVNHHQ